MLSIFDSHFVFRVSVPRAEVMTDEAINSFTRDLPASSSDKLVSSHRFVPNTFSGVQPSVLPKEFACWVRRFPSASYRFRMMSFDRSSKITCAMCWTVSAT